MTEKESNQAVLNALKKHLDVEQTPALRTINPGEPADSKKAAASYEGFIEAFSRYYYDSQGKIRTVDIASTRKAAEGKTSAREAEKQERIVTLMGQAHTEWKRALPSWMQKLIKVSARNLEVSEISEEKNVIALKKRKLVFPSEAELTVDFLSLLEAITPEDREAIIKDAVISEKGPEAGNVREEIAGKPQEEAGVILAQVLLTHEEQLWEGFDRLDTIRARPEYKEYRAELARAFPSLSAKEKKIEESMSPSKQEEAKAAFTAAIKEAVGSKIVLDGFKQSFPDNGDGVAASIIGNLSPAQKFSAYFSGFFYDSIGRSSRLDIKSQKRTVEGKPSPMSAAKRAANDNIVMGSWQNGQGNWTEALLDISIDSTQLDRLSEEKLKVEVNRKFIRLPSHAEVTVDYIAFLGALSPKDMDHLTKLKEALPDISDLNQVVTESSQALANARKLLSHDLQLKEIYDYIDAVRKRPEYKNAKAEFAEAFSSLSSKKSGNQDKKPAGNPDTPKPEKADPVTPTKKPYEVSQNAKAVLRIFTEHYNDMISKVKTPSMRDKIDTFCRGQDKRHLARINGWDSNAIEADAVIDFVDSVESVGDIKTLDRLMLISDVFAGVIPRTPGSFGKDGQLGSKSEFVKLGALAMAIDEAKNAKIEINNTTVSHLAKKLGLGENITSQLRGNTQGEISRMNDPRQNVGLIFRPETSAKLAEKIDRAATTNEVDVRRYLMQGLSHRVGLNAQTTR